MCQNKTVSLPLELTPSDQVDHAGCRASRVDGIQQQSLGPGEQRLSPPAPQPSRSHSLLCSSPHWQAHPLPGTPSDSQAVAGFRGQPGHGLLSHSSDSSMLIPRILPSKPNLRCPRTSPACVPPDEVPKTIQSGLTCSAAGAPRSRRHIRARPWGLIRRTAPGRGACPRRGCRIARLLQHAVAILAIGDGHDLGAKHLIQEQVRRGLASGFSPVSTRMHSSRISPQPRQSGGSGWIGTRPR